MMSKDRKKWENTYANIVVICLVIWLLHHHVVDDWVNFTETNKKLRHIKQGNFSFSILNVTKMQWVKIQTGVSCD
jgi:hypothetical protein